MLLLGIVLLHFDTNRLDIEKIERHALVILSPTTKI